MFSLTVLNTSTRLLAALPPEKTTIPLGWVVVMAGRAESAEGVKGWKTTTQEVNDDRIMGEIN